MFSISSFPPHSCLSSPVLLSLCIVSSFYLLFFFSFFFLSVPRPSVILHSSIPSPVPSASHLSTPLIHCSFFIPLRFSIPFSVYHLLVLLIILSPVMYSSLLILFHSHFSNRFPSLSCSFSVSFLPFFFPLSISSSLIHYCLFPSFSSIHHLPALLSSLASILQRVI